MVCGVATFTLAVPAGIADAAPDPALAQEKSACAAKLATRFADIDKFTARYRSAPEVAARHKTALDAIFSSSRQTFVTIQGQAAQAASMPALKQVCESIVTTVRLYDLREAQVDMTVRNAAAVAQQGKLVAQYIALSNALKKKPAAVRARAARSMRTLQDTIYLAGKAQTGLTTAIVAVTPAQWNANHDALVPLEARLGVGVQKVQEATKLANDVRALIKA
jgi:hypothetical protein